MVDASVNYAKDFSQVVINRNTKDYEMLMQWSKAVSYTHLDGVQHGVLIDLIGTGLDHDDLVHGGGDGQGQVALLALLLGGVQDDLAVHQTHLHACLLYTSSGGLRRGREPAGRER